jgi:hypothetical protein
VKLYIAADGFYVGTKVDAKKLGKGWRTEEVPTDKPGLIDYLNILKLAHPGQPALTTDEPGALVEYFRGDGFQPYGHTGDYEGWQPEETAIHFLRKLKPAAGATAEPAPVYSNKITELEEFILNEASVAQVEQLFARLGTRFKELANGNKLLD